MMKRTTVVAALFVMLAMVSGSAADQGRGGGSSGKSTKDTKDSKDADVSVNFTFNSGDHDTFRNYFRTNKITAEPLPPGIAKKAFPNDLVRGLGSRVRPGITFSIAGDRVVALKDGKVVDIIEGLFR